MVSVTWLSCASMAEWIGFLLMVKTLGDPRNTWWRQVGMPVFPADSMRPSSNYFWRTGTLILVFVVSVIGCALWVSVCLGGCLAGGCLPVWVGVWLVGGWVTGSVWLSVWVSLWVADGGATYTHKQRICASAVRVASQLAISDIAEHWGPRDDSRLTCKLWLISTNALAVRGTFAHSHPLRTTSNHSSLASISV